MRQKNSNAKIFFFLNINNNYNKVDDIYRKVICVLA